MQRITKDIVNKIENFSRANVGKLEELKKMYLSIQKKEGIKKLGTFVVKKIKEPDIKLIKNFHDEKFVYEYTVLEGKIFLGDTEGAKRCLEEHELFIESHRCPISSIAVTNNNQYIVSGSGEKSIRVWNLKENHQEAILKGHDSGVNAVAITYDNKYVVSGSADTSVRVWNLQEKSQEDVLKGHALSLNSVAITNYNKYVFSGSDDKTIAVWDHGKR